MDINEAQEKLFLAEQGIKEILVQLCRETNLEFQAIQVETCRAVEMGAYPPGPREIITGVYISLKI